MSVTDPFSNEIATLADCCAAAFIDEMDLCPCSGQREWLRALFSPLLEMYVADIEATGQIGRLFAVDLLAMYLARYDQVIADRCHKRGEPTKADGARVGAPHDVYQH